MKKLSKTILIASAAVNAIPGILFTFLPQETGGWIGAGGLTGANVVLMQVLGAALLGIAMSNYMSRGLTIGGIYGKPLLLGNLLFHFATGVTLIKFTFNSGEWLLFGIPSFIYLVLAAGFIKLNFTSPI